MATDIFNGVGGINRMNKLTSTANELKAKSDSEKRAYLSFAQVGTAAPTITVLKNEFDADFTITRTSAGNFSLYNSDAFSPGREGRITSLFHYQTPNRYYFFKDAFLDGVVGIDVNAVSTEGGQIVLDLVDGLNTTLEIIRFY